MQGREGSKVAARYPGVPAAKVEIAGHHAEQHPFQGDVLALDLDAASAEVSPRRLNCIGQSFVAIGEDGDGVCVLTHHHPAAGDQVGRLGQFVRLGERPIAGVAHPVLLPEDEGLAIDGWQAPEGVVYRVPVAGGQEWVEHPRLGHVWEFAHAQAGAEDRGMRHPDLERLLADDELFREDRSRIRERQGNRPPVAGHRKGHGLGDLVEQPAVALDDAEKARGVFLHLFHEDADNPAQPLNAIRRRLGWIGP